MIPRSGVSVGAAAGVAILAWGCSPTASEPSRTSPPKASPVTSPDSGEATPKAARGPFVRMACSLPGNQIELIEAGYDPERSGEIQIVPVSPNYFGNHSHSGPWPYLQRIPMFLYGPGHVPPVGQVSRPVTMADLAPTLASHIGFDFPAPDGRPMTEAVSAAARTPRLVVVVVWDGAGRKVLSTHPRAWPRLRKMIPKGAWFDSAEVGSSPSVSPAVHATLGTGALPFRHRVVDLEFREQGDMRSIRDSAGLLDMPTLGDLYDRARGNRPLVGLVGNGLTVGMLGHGERFRDGDRDLLALHGPGVWLAPETAARRFEIPSYLDEVPGLDDAVRRLDLEDGMKDGIWMGADLTDGYELIDTPAFTEYQTQVIREIIRREGFGADRVPDLLFVNYKQVDKVGHRWSMNSKQMEAVVKGSDRALAELVEILDRDVGSGDWVLAVTADHGSTPDASVTGAFSIDIRKLAEDLRTEFDGGGDGRSAIVHTRVTQIWIDEEALRAGGHTMEEVSRFLLRYTRGDNGGYGVPDPDRPLFRAAFPSRILEEELPCLEEKEAK